MSHWFADIIIPVLDALGVSASNRTLVLWCVGAVIILGLGIIVLNSGR